MSDPTREVVARVSRAESVRLVAALTRWIGADRIELAEDAVQDAFVAALRSWPLRGLPADPTAWLYQVARNRILDHLRRRGEAALDLAPPSIDPAPEPGAADPELELLLLCCHPSLSAESATALTLKIAAGFTAPEIARLFLADVRAVEQRLTRAKQRLREVGGALEITPADLPRRIAIALEVLYAMFTEGYASVSAPSGLRVDLCREALRLAELLARTEGGHAGPTHALAALFCFHGSRLGSRVTDEGALTRLQDQDRSTWDRGLIARGQQHLLASATGPELSRYHLEAEIAGCHALAPSYQSTDWARIAELYGFIASRWPSPMVTVNRAVAEAERGNLDGGSRLLDVVAAELDGSHAYHAVRADLELRRGDAALARRHFSRAIALATAEPVRRFLTGRLESLAG
jgi:RNA polymerase sigma-70 factor (ECF subfamily)